MSWLLVGLAGAGLVIGTVALGAFHPRGGLPSSPVAISVRPAVVTAGRPAVVHLDVAAEVPGMPFDLYVVRHLSAEGGTFLTGDGTWATEPRLLARYSSRAEMRPLAVDWPPANEVGWAPLLVILTRPDADPRLSASWLAQPALRLVQLRAPLGDDLVARGAAWELAALGGLSALACGIVLVGPRLLAGPGTSGPGD